MPHPQTLHGLLATAAALLCIHSVQIGDLVSASAEWCISLFYLGLATRRHD